MNNRLFLKSIVILLVLITNFSFAQNKEDVKIANDYFSNENFYEALKKYTKLLKVTPDDYELNYKIGVCYLNTNIDKSLAIPFLEKVLKSENPNSNTLYLLGRSYHYAYRFNDAIKMFEQFKSIGKGEESNLENVDKQIEYCYNAIELMKFPLDISFENMGVKINSKYEDYFPFLPKDESFIIYSSKRDDGSSQESNGSFNSEIYISKVKDGKYENATKLDQNVNTLKGSEEIVGMSANGKHLLFYYDNDDNYGDLFIADFGEEGVSNIKKLPKVINSKNHEIAASISKRGDAIYFASDREGGYGGVDLYVSRKLPNGQWSLAQNLGSTINTPYDEDFPNISPDGKALYFSSKGHTSMGGYDIFKASWDIIKRNWTDVRNIGYPLNTPEDNTNYRESESGRTGYISALREGGLGDLDIYSVTFNEVDPTYTVIKGSVVVKESSSIIKDAFISVLDLQTDEVYGDYLTNPKTGSYVMILPVGKFNIMVEVPGHEMYSKDIEIFGKSSHRSLIKKDIELVPNK